MGRESEEGRQTAQQGTPCNDSQTPLSDISSTLLPLRYGRTCMVYKGECTQDRSKT